MKIYVFIGMWKGILEEVKCYKIYKEACKRFKDWTGYDIDFIDLMDIEWKGSTIVECEINLEK